MQTGESETKKDLRAAAHTAHELGPDYENEIMDGFLQRLDQRINAQVAVGVRRGLAENGIAPAAPRQPRGRSNAFQYVSLGAAVPLSAIGAGVGHVPGLLVAWLGIVGLNFVQLRSQRQEDRRQERQERRGDDW